MGTYSSVIRKCIIFVLSSGTLDQIHTVLYVKLGDFHRWYRVMSFSELFKAYKKGNAEPTKTNLDNVQTRPISLALSPTWQQTDEFCSNYVEISNTTVVSNKKTLALLFMIQKDFPNELLWRLWIERLKSTDCIVKIWIHAKDPSQVRSKWVRNRLVRKFQLQPGWGSLELTKTMVCLLFEAMLDCHSIDMFAFASESCMPFESISRVFDCICPEFSDTTTNKRKSWIQYRETPNNGYSRIQQFEVIKGRIPNEHILKGDQWVALAYQHVRKLLQCISYLDLYRSKGNDRRSNVEQTRLSSLGHNNADQTQSQNSEVSISINTNTDDFMQSLSFSKILQSPIFQLFAGMKASDEMFFPTVLSMLGYRSEIEKRRWTYAEWEGQASSPISFLPGELLKKVPNLDEIMEEYHLPQSRLLHPNFVRAQMEHTLFFRKIKWENISYFRDLPFPSNISKHDSQKEKDKKQEEEIAALLAHAPVAQQLDLVQRWWLWVHRDELKQLQVSFEPTCEERQNEDIHTNASVSISAVKRYWEEICIPIVANVLYYNRPIDRRHHRALEEIEDKVVIDGEVSIENSLGIKRAISTADNGENSLIAHTNRNEELNGDAHRNKK